MLLYVDIRTCTFITLYNIKPYQPLATKKLSPNLIYTTCSLHEKKSQLAFLLQIYTFDLTSANNNKNIHVYCCSKSHNPWQIRQYRTISPLLLLTCGQSVHKIISHEFSSSHSRYLQGAISAFLGWLRLPMARLSRVQTCLTLLLLLQPLTMPASRPHKYCNISQKSEAKLPKFFFEHY